MTSAEWDLRALKALEQEQEKHKKHQQQQQPHLKKHTYLGLSQRSLYDPSPSSSLPITPPSLKKSLVKQLPTANTQHFIHTALKERSAVPVPAPATNASNSSAASSASASNSYVQLQAQQLLKLPTISEHHQQYLLAQKKRGGGKDSAGGKLKFSKVLSLSAQSLTNRLGSRKSKNKSGNSPGHYVASSPPMYTPPPTRRCNTLHHTPQVRKTFKTLQELERRKLEARPGELQITRTLHRIAGTHKTYWKYGINSTANSIVGQHQQKQQQQQQQNLPQQRGSQPKRGHNSELESYTSDELDSEENQSPEQPDSKELGLESRGEPQHKEEGEAEEDGEGLAFDFDDNATEVGSCTVPLASDSIEMMNLMLSAAQTAVITQPSITANQPAGDPQQPPPPDLTAIINSKDNRVSTTAAATGGGGGIQIPKYFTLGHSQQQHQQQHRHHSFNRFSDTEDYVVASPPLPDEFLAGGSFLPLHPHPQNGETVAFKALQQLARRKSFSGEKMRAHSLQRNVSLNYSYGDDDDDGVALQQPEDSTENGNDSDQNSEEQNHGNDGQGDDDDVNNSSVLNITSTVMRANSTRRQSRSYVNNRSLLKASSLDVPPSALVYTTDFNVPNSTTIITNPLMNATAQHHHTHHGHHPAPLNLLKSSSSSSGKPLKTSAQIKQKLLAVSSNNKSTFNDLNSVRLRPPGGQNLQQLSPASMVHSPPSDGGSGGGDEALHHFAPQHLHLNFHHASTLSPDIYDNACTNSELCSAAMSSLIIDDELEQHIKQCSCSCNHMGYGNSMDYQ
uniref:Uncharacterized protein n=1 Tax=Musca domestica TaxID=7370 RepID=A0A1I8MR94_MUSDO